MMKNNFKKLYKSFGLFTKMYSILFVLVFFSGSTILSHYVMQLVSCMVLIAFMVAKIKGIKKLAFIVKTDYSIIFLMCLIDIFLIWQLRYSYSFDTSLVFVMRFIVYTAVISITFKPDVIFCLIKICKYYSFSVAMSIILMCLITGKKTGGLVGSYQYAGILMAVSAVFFLADYYNENRKFNLIGLIFVIIALLTSGKRALSLITLFGYIVIFIVAESKNKIIKFFKLSSALIIVVGIAYTLVPQVRLVANRFIEYSGDSTYNGRLYFWEVSLDIWKNNKLFGVGMGTFSQYFDTFYHRTGNMEAYDAHNVYIQMLSDIGIVGFILFVLFFAISLIKTVKLAFYNEIRNNKQYAYIIYISLYVQIWFIIYCLTGNPLYGASECFIYMASIGMMLSVNSTLYKQGIKTHKKILLKW